MQRVSAGLALGAAAAAALWWFMQHQASRDRDGDDGADGGSGGELAASEAAAGVASSSRDAPQAADRAPGSKVDLASAAAIKEEEVQVAAAAQAERARRAAVVQAARQALARATRNELLVHDMLLAGQEGDVPFLPPLEAEGTAAPPGTAPARLAAGRGAAPAPSSAALPGDSLAALAAPPADEAEALRDMQQTVAETIERAFFDSLAEGLRRGETDRLAALLLDARDQLAALLPQSAAAAQQRGGQGSGVGGEAQALLAELMEKLDADYVSQRLQQYDAPYCAQAFNLLVHTIGRLQAPARRGATQQQYSQVAELFAAAAAADAGAAAAAEAAPAGSEAVAGSAHSKAEPGSRVAACLPAGPHDGEQKVQLQLEEGAGGRVAVRLLPPPAAAEAVPACADAEALAPASPAAHAGEAEGVQLHLQLQGDSVAAILTPASAAAAAVHTTTSSGGSGQPKQAGSKGAAGAGEPLRWELRLAPSPHGDGSVAVIMAPVALPSTPDAAEPLPAAEHSQPGTPQAAAGPGSSAVSEASIAAVVAAARFMHRQLNELKADVAAAHLALLKEAILGSGSGIEYERQRYARALQAASAAVAAAEGGAAGAASEAEDAASAVVAEALPITAAWLRQALLEAPPPPPYSPQRPDPAFARACVASGLLLLLQRPQAVSTVDCPETLLLDLPAIVALQNELQRLSLLAASLLIIRQILAHKRALPPAGSPAAQALALRVLRRMGSLLSSGPPLEALVLELHQQAKLALAQHALHAAPEGEAADSQAAAGGGSDAAADAPGVSAQEAHRAQPEQQGVELELVRRMVQQIFSTEHTAYRRVQAGIVAAATALLRSAAASADAGGGAGAASWRVTLRGIGAELLAPEVHRLATALDRVAAVSAAVAHPIVYLPLLATLLREEALQAALQRRRH